MRDVFLTDEAVQEDEPRGKHRALLQWHSWQSQRTETLDLMFECVSSRMPPRVVVNRLEHMQGKILMYLYPARKVPR